MEHRHGTRLGWVGAALLMGTLVPTQAQAVIPFDGQLTPGQLRGISYDAGDPWLYGYWEYLPSNFAMLPPGSAPLLIFLPGIGEYDDVSSCPGGTDVCAASDCGSDGLCRNLTWGPQLLMQSGDWDEVLRPFIMVSPQHPVPPGSTIPWDVARIDDFIAFVVANYPVDPRRIYIIGMSQGGRGVLQYTQAYPRRAAAIAPTPGGQVDNDASCYFQDTALWVFHGENDADGNLGPGVFNPCTLVDLAYQYDNPGMYVGSAQCLSIVGEPRPTGRLTMYYGVGHFAWIQTVDPIGSGFPASEWTSDQGCGIPATFREYEAALDSDGVYSWFLSLDRPDVEAPPDSVVSSPSTSLTAIITDDDPVTIEWTQIGGPPATLSNTDTDTLDVDDLLESEVYTFQVYVLDADQQWDLDEVMVTTQIFGGGSSGSSGSSDDGGSSFGTGDGDTTGGEGGGSTSTGTSGASTSSSGGEPPPGGTTGSGGADGGTTSGSGSGGSTGEPGASDGGSGGGCGCRTQPRGPFGWAIWSLPVFALRRRRAR